MSRRSGICWLVAAGIMMLAGTTCTPDTGLPLPPREREAVETNGLTLVARIAHITDTHIVDEQSPARFAGAQVLTSTAWRPYEAYSAQILDGVIRTVNRLHASGRTIDFVLHTGDACDNAQSNELAWLLAVMDGGVVDPLSGPDDRPIDGRPDALMDPHAVFEAQGLYQCGRHGELVSIPWYVLVGNHEVRALGVFPMVESPAGHRTAPLPLDCRPGLVLPVRLDPVGSLAYGRVTPADPGPPALFEVPAYVAANPDRAFLSRPEFIGAMFDTATGPPGHGFGDDDRTSGWYSVTPVPGLRLIALDTTDAPFVLPGLLRHEGAVSVPQLDFLRAELDTARDRGEIVIVASHHPSGLLRAVYGSALVQAGLESLLNEYPNVVLHLCGHLHRNRVTGRGGYVEIETCSTLDAPQEGRLIEIWRDGGDGSITLAYEMFSHLDDELPSLGDDLLRPMREEAWRIARGDKSAPERQKRFDPGGEDPRGRPGDRHGTFKLHLPR